MKVEWLGELRQNLECDPTARRAWKKLGGAGLESEGVLALWHYAHPPTEYLRKGERRTRHLSAQLRALIRAGKVEQHKQTAGDPRAKLFFERYWDKHVDAVRAETPFADGGTLGDWLISRAARGGAPGYDLPKLRREIVRVGGERSPLSNPKFWLWILRCYATNAGVQIGSKSLVALANCARPRDSLDERSLARYLASVPPGVDTATRRSLASLPAPRQPRLT